MAMVNLGGKQRHSEVPVPTDDQYALAESARGGRYLVAVATIGFLFWLAMAFALGAWAT